MQTMKQAIFFTLLLWLTASVSSAQQPINAKTKQKAAVSAMSQSNGLIRTTPSILLQHGAEPGTYQPAGICRDSVIEFTSVVYEDDLTPYYREKDNCQSWVNVSCNGSIIVTYSDGTKKIAWNAKVEEVITPDGIKHIQKPRPPCHNCYVVRRTLPLNPDANSKEGMWLQQFNEQLIQDISTLLGDEQMYKYYQKRETVESNGNVYKQMELRTTFIEEYSKAKKP